MVRDAQAKQVCLEYRKLPTTPTLVVIGDAAFQRIDDANCLEMRGALFVLASLQHGVGGPRRYDLPVLVAQCVKHSAESSATW